MTINGVQQLDFEPVEHVDRIFSILIDGWTLLWWGLVAGLAAGVWWFVRRKRSARELDGS